MKHGDYLKKELWVIKRKDEIEILPVEQLTKKDKRLGRYRLHEKIKCIKKCEIDTGMEKPFFIIKRGKIFEIVDNGDLINGFLHIPINNYYHECLSSDILEHFKYVKQKKEYTKADILEAKILDWKRGFKAGREGIKEGLIAINKLIGEKIEYLKKLEG
ncbi:MAG: hypothetical protein AABY22_01490 [Nanoarchaeota archaeon]